MGARIMLRSQDWIEMAQPSKLLQKLSTRLFDDDAERDRFIAALLDPLPSHPCILWCGNNPGTTPFDTAPPLPWQPVWIDRLAIGSRPGQHPLHQQGAYYCIDFSSIFAASVLCAVPQSRPWAIDLCAAPGGKSIFLWKLLQPQHLIANEVIGKRLGMLKSNLQRCGIYPASITNLDPQIFATHLPQAFPVAIVDAPCSGQSLLAKGSKAPGCFHPVTLNKNANRQKRILANTAALIAPQGYLAYTTCTYSLEENEQVCAWFLKRFPQFQPVAVPHLAAYQSTFTDHPCYRLWPQQGLGAGAFAALFQQQDDSAPARSSPSTDATAGALQAFLTKFAIASFSMLESD